MDLDVRITGQGPDLVLLHSLLTDRGAFSAIEAELVKSFRVHLVDLPGYGGSKSKGEAAIEDYADRVAAMLPRSANLLGNGFGGFIAVSTAIRHPDKVARLIAAPALAGFPAP